MELDENRLACFESFSCHFAKIARLISWELEGNEISDQVNPINLPDYDC